MNRQDGPKEGRTQSSITTGSDIELFLKETLSTLLPDMLFWCAKTDSLDVNVPPSCCWSAEWWNEHIRAGNLPKRSPRKILLTTTSEYPQKPSKLRGRKWSWSVRGRLRILMLQQRDKFLSFSIRLPLTVSKEIRFVIYRSAAEGDNRNTVNEATPFFKRNFSSASTFPDGNSINFFFFFVLL